jgi:hypothetical protein
MDINGPPAGSDGDGDGGWELMNLANYSSAPLTPLDRYYAKPYAVYGRRRFFRDARNTTVHPPPNFPPQTLSHLRLELIDDMIPLPPTTLILLWSTLLLT